MMIQKLNGASLSFCLLLCGCVGPGEDQTTTSLESGTEVNDRQPSIIQGSQTAETLVETHLPPPLSEIADPEVLRKAIAELQTLAERGNSEANYRLGGAFNIGQGVTVQPKKAFEHTLTAAQAGHAGAQHCVAMMYHDGVGTEPNGSQTLYWCKESAKQGSSLAQFWVGMFHEFGVYAEQDAQAACRYYENAAAQGWPEAQTRLGLCCALGDGTKLDLRRARELFESAYEAGMDLPALRKDLWQQAVEIDEYPALRIAEHQAKFAKLTRDMDPATESYLGPNGTWVFRQDSVLSRQEREFDQLMAELMQSKSQRDRQIKRLLNTIDLIDEITQTQL